MLVCAADEHVSDECLAVVALNRKLLVLLRYDDADAAGVAASWWPRIFPDPGHRRDQQVAWAGAIHALSRTGEGPGPIEARVTCGDGTERCLELELGLHAGFAFALCKDVTERRQAEAELTEASGFLRRLVDTSPSMIFVVDEAGRLVFANRSVATYYETTPESLLRRGTEEVHANAAQAEGFVQDDIEVIRTGREIVKEELNTAPDGRVHWFHTIKVPLVRPDGRVQCLGISTDITARKQAEDAQRQLEAAMWQSQKLESLGVLASGVAHDFNNLLASIRTNAFLLNARLPTESPARPFVEGIELATQRASLLTGQLLAYVGRGQTSPVRLCVADLVRGMQPLFDAVVSKKAQFRLELEPGLVEADAAQLHQVVMNLVSNASDSLGEDSGQLVIRTGTRELQETQLRSISLEETLPAGSYAYIEVEDEGCGMATSTARKIFDPFFSTKFTGRGLGLSAVLGIVRGHRGSVQVDSQVGRGSRFIVLLPSIAPVPASSTVPCVSVLAARRGTVLVVDDEELVRSTVCAMLEDAGFVVLSAADGQEGVDEYERHQNEVDAVILDLTMPRLDGWQCMQRLRAMRHDLPILLMSGYSAQLSVPHGMEPAPQFLQKPFDPELLVEMAAQLVASANESCRVSLPPLRA
jgi:PAS domain S-box-containing protein